MLYIFFNLMFTYARLENFSLHLYVNPIVLYKQFSQSLQTYSTTINTTSNYSTTVCLMVCA